MSDAIRLSKYVGSVSRFLDLHGLAVDASKNDDKLSAELESFDRWLSAAAESRRKSPSENAQEAILALSTLHRCLDMEKPPESLPAAALEAERLISSLRAELKSRPPKEDFPDL